MPHAAIVQRDLRPQRLNCAKALAGDERSLAEFGPHLRQLSLIVGKLTVCFEERV